MRKAWHMLKEAFYLMRKDKLLSILAVLFVVLALAAVLVFQLAPAAVVTFIYAGV